MKSALHCKYKKNFKYLQNLRLYALFTRPAALVCSAHVKPTFFMLIYHIIVLLYFITVCSQMANAAVYECQTKE